MSFLPLEQLRDGAYQLGIGLTDEQIDRLDRFAALMVEANRRHNLTRITEPEAIVTLHYLDSLTTLAAADCPAKGKLVDVGAGAGFPGIPIAIARPDVSVTLVDSTRKKVEFLSVAIEGLGLANTTALHARAEDLGHQKAHREHYDLACARALGEMGVLAELCLPLVRVGGWVVAQKSTDVSEEMDRARPIIGQLGGYIEKSVDTRIPYTDITRKLLVIVKAKPCPERFPRAYAQIVKKRPTRPAG